MSHADNEEIPLRSMTASDEFGAEAIEQLIEAGRYPSALDVFPDDRMSPLAAGCLTGVLGAVFGLAIADAFDPRMLARLMIAVADARGVTITVSFAIAFATAAAIGGLVGATFGAVTHHLRKWAALLVWALVFFVSFAILVVAISGISSTVAGPVLVGTVFFAIVMSFSLPIRLRR